MCLAGSPDRRPPPEPLDTNDTNGDTIVLRATGSKATSLLVQELGWEPAQASETGRATMSRRSNAFWAGLQRPLGWCAAAVQNLDHDGGPAKGNAINLDHRRAPLLSAILSTWAATAPFSPSFEPFGVGMVNNRE